MARLGTAPAAARSEAAVCGPASSRHPAHRRRRRRRRRRAEKDDGALRRPRHDVVCPRAGLHISAAGRRRGRRRHGFRTMGRRALPGQLFDDPAGRRQGMQGAGARCWRGVAGPRRFPLRRRRSFTDGRRRARGQAAREKRCRESRRSAPSRRRSWRTARLLRRRRSPTCRRSCSPPTRCTSRGTARPSGTR